MYEDKNRAANGKSVHPHHLKKCQNVAVTRTKNDSTQNLSGTIQRAKKENDPFATHVIQLKSTIGNQTTYPLMAQMNGLPINHSKALEHEPDVFGGKVAQEKFDGRGIGVVQMGGPRKVKNGETRRKGLAKVFKRPNWKKGTKTKVFIQHMEACNRENGKPELSEVEKEEIGKAVEGKDAMGMKFALNIRHLFSSSDIGLVMQSLIRMNRNPTGKEAAMLGKINASFISFLQLVGEDKEFVKRWRNIMFFTKNKGLQGIGARKMRTIKKYYQDLHNAPRNLFIGHYGENQGISNAFDCGEEGVNTHGLDHVKHVHGAWKDIFTDLGLNPRLEDRKIYTKKDRKKVEAKTVKLWAHNRSNKKSRFVPNVELSQVMMS